MIGSRAALDHHFGRARLHWKAWLLVSAGWAVAALAIAVHLVGRWAVRQEMARKVLEGGAAASNSGLDDVPANSIRVGAGKQGATAANELPWSTSECASPGRPAALDVAGICRDSTAQLNVSIRWHAPFLSGGGYASEAVAFALALVASPAVEAGRLQIAQHGDGVSDSSLLVGLRMSAIM